MEREKSERVSANKKRHHANREDAAPGSSAVPATVKLSTKLDPTSSRGQIAKGKAIKKELKQASYYAGVSTASMGKFDKRLSGEGDDERKLPGSRKKVLSVTEGEKEKSVAGKILGKVMRWGFQSFPCVCRPLIDCCTSTVLVCCCIRFFVWRLGMK